MMATDDLVAFLLARLDEDEEVAQAAFDPKHRGEWAWRKDSRTTVRTSDGAPIEPAAPDIERGPHIARWHPARVLREVEAKRLLLMSVDNDLLPLLALPYAAHPDYRDEWRP